MTSPNSVAGPLSITITYDPILIAGRLSRSRTGPESIWDRLKSRAVDISGARISLDTIEMPWAALLDIVREFGTRLVQQRLKFRFAPTGEAAEKLKNFVAELRIAQAARDRLNTTLTQGEIVERLRTLGFTKLQLKPFQLRDLERLVALPHGANFSVPGAGKTSVTLALHMLVRQSGQQHFFVAAPKAAFPAWSSVVDECIAEDAPAESAERFTFLEGEPDEVERLLRSGSKRFVMSYDLMIRQQSVIATYLARQPVHLVLDEAHRIKAGVASQRGAFLLNVANLPSRRDILTGTPMPHAASDLAAQLGFLWPGHGLDVQLMRGIAPRTVLSNLYVRTTKSELGLPPVTREFHQVRMADGQMALYAIVRNEALRQLKAATSTARGVDILSARRSVMRLLQLSANPILALKAMSGDANVDSGIVDQILSEGRSTKMQAVADHARQLAQEGQKTVIWTIFTDTILEMETMLADLNPVSLYGAIPTGDANDVGTREGRLRKFHANPDCQVMIANPAAAGEGISLHTVCHNAIYLDRSYVSTHYLQSIDRIHRLGLQPGVTTHIHIYQTKAPAGIGSIDLSVSRRLRTKVRNLQQLLNDPDLHQLALDEEDSDDPIDYDVDLQDLVDLIEELEGKNNSPTEDEQ